MRVRFWGTRGSIARPGPTTLRYGGNTACVEVLSDDGTLVVLDCGTGARDLARELCAGRCPERGHLLIGHTHWDHIQGFPFFDPLFMQGSRWDIYAPGGRGRDLEAALSGQMTYEYFPVSLEALNAEVRLHDLTEGAFELGSIHVTTQYMNHPAVTLGYRLEADGSTVVYATDHEPHWLHPQEAPVASAPVHYEDRRHVEFLGGADLVIHDAQYTLDEFPDKAGWGHTPVEAAVDCALLAGAKRLALFHHDPDRDDRAVSRLVQIARERVAAGGSSLEVFAAAEGQSVELAGTGAQARLPEVSALLPAARDSSSTVLIVDDDPDMVQLLDLALRADGAHVVKALDGESALALARRERPTLVLLDMNLPELDGLGVCRALRSEPDRRLRDAPILMLTGEKLKDTDLLEAFQAGATDYMTKPIKPTLVRARVRRWLLRSPRE